jgi:hypothetical protein
MCYSRPMSAVRAATRVADRPAPAAHRWLVFVHQLPAQPSNARVKTWRRLQQIGAVAIKNAVHVLPNTSQAAEDFQWLRTEVLALGGQATIFEASSISGVQEKHIIRQFKKAQTEEYARLNKDIRALSARLGKRFRPDDDAVRTIHALQDRLRGALQQDFFGATGGRKAEAALEYLAARSHPSPRRSARQTRPPGEIDRRDYLRRTWVTRPRPGVDRFASAWLILRFVDPHATFVFAESPAQHPDAVPFDMYQSGGFKHEGDQCTFEVLQRRFGIIDHAVQDIANVVHDLDLKDDRFKHPHRATIGALVEGLRSSISEDGKLLEQGIVLFEALYQSFRPPKSKAGAKSTR